MRFTRIPPPVELQDIVECYWIAENDDPTPVTQKIIPDGFPEIIFHYGDPYRIRLGEHWEIQTSTLLAGQITKHFQLENCGVSKVLGVKLKPASITRLYGISADRLTDKVLDLRSVSGIFEELSSKMMDDHKNEVERRSILNEHFRSLRTTVRDELPEKALAIIFTTKGKVSVEELATALFVTERQLERSFKLYVGLSPKFYCRIIRFSHIFQCIQKKDIKWSDIVYETGFYDQSHFIRNFKSFTGEEPSSYLFDNSNMANFFMNKK